MHLGTAKVKAKAGLKFFSILMKMSFNKKLTVEESCHRQKFNILFRAWRTELY